MLSTKLLAQWCPEPAVLRGKPRNRCWNMRRPSEVGAVAAMQHDPGAQAIRQQIIHVHHIPQRALVKGVELDVSRGDGWEVRRQTGTENAPDFAVSDRPEPTDCPILCPSLHL